jgi:polar amino acid transport system permease protein
MDLQGFGDQLLLGLWVTVQVALCALALGLALGLGGGLGKVYGPRWLRAAVEVYTAVFRGLPEFLVVLVVYFAGAVVLTETIGGGRYVDVPPFVAGVVALASTFGAYATEVFRGALQAVPAGQAEAGKAIGLAGPTIFRRIVLPQVWRYALPGLGNLFLVLIKDTALVSLIGVDDLMRKADIARNATKDSFTVYTAAAVLYLLLTAVSTAVLAVLEKRAARGVLRPG